MSRAQEGTALKRETIQFRVEEDLRLTADTIGPEDGAPVLLLHGGGQTRHAWTETAEALASLGWLAVSVDQRGHGDSDWSPTGDYRHERFSGDVRLIARSLSRPPVLVGASLGGISSLLAIGASDEPLARALVLVDIATRIEFGGAARIISFMASAPDGFATVEEAGEAIARYNPHRPRPKNLTGLARNLRKRDDGRYVWHWDPAFIDGRHMTTERIHDPDLLDRAARNLRVPTLLVRGRMSDLLSEEGARTFLAQVPHAKFVDVSGAGHMVAGDKNDAFTKAVTHFLSTSLGNGDG